MAFTNQSLSFFVEKNFLKRLNLALLSRKRWKLCIKYYPDSTWHHQNSISFYGELFLKQKWQQKLFTLLTFSFLMNLCIFVVNAEKVTETWVWKKFFLQNKFDFGNVSDGSGQNFLTHVKSFFVVWVGSGQPSLLWVWVLKISPKTTNFFNFSPSDQKNLLGLGQKVSGSASYFYGQKYVCIGQGQGPSIGNIDIGVKANYFHF